MKSTTCLLIYLACISLVSVIICIHDKRAATRHPDKRTRESTLLVLSALGGSLAMLLTMLLSRHKTKHLKFMLGIPLIMVAQIAAALLFHHFFAK